MFSSRVSTWSNYNQWRGGLPATNPSYTWTIPVGVANINTSIKQFGSGSMFGNTGGGYIQTTNTNNAMAVGTGDFTVEGWYYVPSARSIISTVDAIVNIIL